MIRQFELVEKVRHYDQNIDEDSLNRAYVFAMKAHGSQKRASGDPYFNHPLEVAGILTQLKLDTASIITALLHDTVEDTDVTLEDVQKNFGDEVAQLVDGVTKLNQLEKKTLEATQAENLRKLVLAMSKDIRVLLVKLADRLHNMRTLDDLKDSGKRRRIAIETLQIYAPLAERIGMHQFKDELENLAFRELHPDEWHAITDRLKRLQTEEKDIIEKTVSSLRDNLAQDGLKAHVYGRQKTPYSIWRKTQKYNISFEDLFDIMAFRVVVDTLPQCYQALGILHSHFSMIPDRFKDFISTPKPNGYQSIHTGIIGPNRQRIEIQIRTQAMHEIAEHGVAAHWRYKQTTDSKTDGKQYRWIRELLDILDQSSGPEEFLEHTKLEMFEDQVFCFSPKGDVYSLPQGATIVDFAYAVHSEVGDHCMGGKVNGRLVPLRTELHNGDQVEIVTTKSAHPSPEWERFVITGKARSRIRRFIRSQQRDQFISLGREILTKTLKQDHITFHEKDVEKILPQFKQATIDDLLANLGSGIIHLHDVVHALVPTPTTPQHPQGVEIKTKPKKTTQGDSIRIQGLIPGMAVHLARCCHPIPGDRIVGIVVTGKGVTLHTNSCKSLEQFKDQPDRWLSVAWDIDEPNNELRYVGRLKIILANKQGSLSTISTIIAKNAANISNIKITYRATDFYEMIVDVDVRNVEHLHILMAALRTSPLVNSVVRS